MLYCWVHLNIQRRKYKKHHTVYGLIKGYLYASKKKNISLLVELTKLSPPQNRTYNLLFFIIFAAAARLHFLFFALIWWGEYKTRYR